MKKLLIILLLLSSCRKVEVRPEPNPIVLGVKSTSTSIKSINQTGNIVTAVFETTVGAKYSVQIVPFGSEEPVKREGFTATEVITQKTYNLSYLARKD